MLKPKSYIFKFKHFIVKSNKFCHNESSNLYKVMSSFKIPYRVRKSAKQLATTLFSCVEHIIIARQTFELPVYTVGSCCCPIYLIYCRKNSSIFNQINIVICFSRFFFNSRQMWFGCEQSSFILTVENGIFHHTICYVNNFVHFSNFV